MRANKQNIDTHCRYIFVLKLVATLSNQSIDIQTIFWISNRYPKLSFKYQNIVWISILWYESSETSFKTKMYRRYLGIDILLVCSHLLINLYMNNVLLFSLSTIKGSVPTTGCVTPTPEINTKNKMFRYPRLKKSIDTLRYPNDTQMKHWFYQLSIETQMSNFLRIP